MKTLSAAKKLVQRLVLAQLKEDVDVLCVLEEVLEADDVVLVERAMNFDLRHQLLLGTSLCECGLGDDFGGRDSLILQVCELEAASETTFTEELALEILLDANLSVVLDNFLLDDGLSAIDSFFGVTLLHFSLNDFLTEDYY